MAHYCTMTTEEIRLLERKKLDLIARTPRSSAFVKLSYEDKKLYGTKLLRDWKSGRRTSFEPFELRFLKKVTKADIDWGIYA